jgi:hypothetical protein
VTSSTDAPRRGSPSALYGRLPVGLVGEGEFVDDRVGQGEPDEVGQSLPDDPLQQRTGSPTDRGARMSASPHSACGT